MKYQAFWLTLAVAAGCSGAAMAGQAEGAGESTAVIRTTDDTMTCDQMADEAATLSETMGEKGHGSGVFHTLGGVARSGAALLIPGAGLAMAGADAATQGSRDRHEAAADATDRRWYYLNGLYAGRQCGHTAQDPQAASVVVVAPQPGVQPASLTTTPADAPR